MYVSDGMHVCEYEFLFCEFCVCVCVCVCICMCAMDCKRVNRSVCVHVHGESCMGAVDAMGILDRIRDVEEEMARTQKNKATEHHLGQCYFVCWGCALMEDMNTDTEEAMLTSTHTHTSANTNTSMNMKALPDTSTDTYKQGHRKTLSVNTETHTDKPT